MNLEMLLEKQYGKDIAKEIIKGCNEKRYTTLRINTLKSTTAEIEKYCKMKKLITKK